MSIASATGSSARNRISLDRLAAVALLCLVAAAYVPLLAQYAAELWATAGYQLAPLAWVLAAICAWQQARALDEPVGLRRWWASVLPAGLAAALLALAIATQMPEMAAVSLLMLALAAMVRFGRAKLVDRRLGPWVLACLVLRPPAGVDLWCFHSAAKLSMAAAHRVLDAVGVLHDPDGLSIMTAAGKLFTGGMLYGLFSPWSAVAITVAVCAWFRRSRVDTVLMLAAGCGWFVLVDVLRICATVVLSNALEAAPIPELARAALDYAALILMFLLIVSSDRVVLLFRTALRLGRPKRTRRSRSAVKPLVITPMVTVTGMKLDASGRLIKVVSESPRENLPQSSSAAQAVPAASVPHRGRRTDGLLVAIAYGLLCLVQAVWLPTASSAAASSRTAAEAAVEISMPADSDGWRLESPAPEQDRPPAGAAASDTPGHVVARWAYRRENLIFTLAVRARDPAWQAAAVPWVDRGWQLDSSEKSSGDHGPANPSIPYREALLSKPHEALHACLWASSWDPAEESLSDWPAGWRAAVSASAEQAEEMWWAARNVDQTGAARRGAAEDRLNIEGSLVSYAALTPGELTAGRELYCLLVAKLERGMASRTERRP